jgi:Rrf2 family protein
MTNAIRISEAGSLALHAMAFLAASPRRRLTTGEIASELNVSEAHLSKVLQRLAKAGLVRSARGAKGGFELARPRGKVSLLEVYEAIEGPLSTSKCLLGLPVCGARRCILGDLVEVVNKRVRDHLSKTRLSKLSDCYGSGEA